MNVVIVVVASSSQLSGVSRHAANLARCLLTRADIASVHLIAATQQYQSLCGVVPHEDARLHIHTVDTGEGTLARNLWYYFKLPALAARLDADIVHFAYPAPLRSGAFHCPTVVTLHDLYPYDIPDNFGFPKVIFNRLILRQCLRNADAIASVSESTVRQLKLYVRPELLQKTITIYNCVEPGPALAIKSPLPDWKGEPILLCVAQHRRNKNLLLVLRIFHRLICNGEIEPTGLLLIVGIEGPETARIRQFIQTAGLARNVVLLHGVSDAELQWCYRNCELLLLLSSIEGFGLPVVEAMLNHCRVVCSDIPAFREVGGSYCHYAALHPSPEDAALKAIRLARKDLKFRPVDVARFSSARIADHYLELYLDLRKHHSSKNPGVFTHRLQSEGEGSFEHLR